MESWADKVDALARLDRRQLFFVGGAPRSGTTWLQQMLDQHPDISCRGEGLFQHQLALQLDKLVEERRRVLEAKNARVFGRGGGYLLPPQDDAEYLLRTGILLALDRQVSGRSVTTVGEKTPENVFFFPRLKRLFPRSKFIGIARDPRDVLTSAWHFFGRPAAGREDAEAKIVFIRTALPSLQDGMRALISLIDHNPADCIAVTYEALRTDPAPALASLYRFLGVSDRGVLVQDALERTSFAVQTSGRQAGVGEDGAFRRKGVVGDWRSTLTPEMAAMVLETLGWAFPRFGWAP
jgi:hypothetical protein